MPWNALRRKFQTEQSLRTGKTAKWAVFATKMRQFFEQRANGLIVWDQPNFFLGQICEAPVIDDLLAQQYGQPTPNIYPRLLFRLAAMKPQDQSTVLEARLLLRQPVPPFDEFFRIAGTRDIVGPRHPP